MRRFLGFLLVAGLLIGGASGCSSDDDKKADATTEETTADEGGETTGSENADVKAYCDAVDEYVAAAKDVGTDPAKAQALTEQATDLSTKAGALATAGLSADDAQAVADCTEKSTAALMPS